LAGESCVPECQPAMYLSREPRRCETCPAGTGPGEEDCAPCAPEAPAPQWRCVPTCREGFYPADSHGLPNKVCKRCDDHCSACEGSGGNCLKCKEGFNLLGGSCVTNETCTNVHVTCTVVHPPAKPYCQQLSPASGAKHLGHSSPTLTPGSVSALDLVTLLYVEVELPDQTQQAEPSQLPHSYPQLFLTVPQTPKAVSPGYKIPVIENLGATLDQFDAIDFSDNEIRKLDGFPLLRRLKTLLMNNNRICRIGESLEQALPSLTELILTNNNIAELGELDPLSTIKSLTYLSILRNPVTNKKHYRLYVIHKVPQVRVLDFQKVKLKERQEAEKMFKGKRGAQLAKDIARRTKTFNPGAGLPTDKKKAGPSPGDVEAIKTAIANATTLAEVERLKGLLQAGQIPGRERKSGPSEDAEEEMEEDTVPNGS
ncbi:PREDICTED: U2 small nuclear ribonucleoprotein A', partial [Aptenodytes forsteri]